MAGARVDMPLNGAADWSSFVDIVQLMMESFMSVSLTNMGSTAEPLIESIGTVLVKGTCYKFASDETITGWAGISVSTEAYIYIVPSGATCTAEWSNTAPTWDSDYQGYYNGNNRCIGGAYKDGSGNCINKWVARGQRKWPKRSTVFTSNGTYTVPAGVYRIRVTVVGGGGGGGGRDNASGSAGSGGGGGGGAAIKQLSVIPSASYAIVVGAGGAGGTGNQSGFAGGTSSFDAAGINLNATGGNGGTVNSTGLPHGGAGGTGSNGDPNIGGGGGGAGGFGALHNGAGGESILGGGARQQLGSQSNGEAGGNYGGGGSGGLGSAAVARNGGAGADGIVVIEEVA